MSKADKFHKALEQLEVIAENATGMDIAQIYFDIVEYRYYIENELENKNKIIDELENDLEERKLQMWNHKCK